jgi:hypothetical protein
MSLPGQPSLFDDDADECAPNKLARASDPQTSQDAGAAILPRVAELQQWAAECVTASPGLTQRELGKRYCADDPRRIGRRLNECADLGLVCRGEARVCSISGRKAETWWPPTGTTEEQQ